MGTDCRPTGFKFGAVVAGKRMRRTARLAQWDARVHRLATNHIASRRILRER